MEKENLTQFAVVIEDNDGGIGGHFIEFYWAEDAGHALEQAMNAHPGDLIGAVAKVPVEVKP